MSAAGQAVTGAAPFTAATGWALLTIAGLLEIGWAIGMKKADGFTHVWWSIVTVALMIASMYLLVQAARVLPIGTAYAVWTGIGAVGAATLGIIIFKEPATSARIACIALILAGIVGLKLSHPA